MCMMQTLVVVCQNRFIPSIKTKSKQTELRIGSGCVVGDTLEFRDISQEKFGSATCVSVTPIILYKMYVANYFAGNVTWIESDNNLESFAKREGFPSYEALVGWLMNNYPGKEGWAMDLIYWGNTFVKKDEVEP